MLLRRLDGLDGPARNLAERLALYRAFYTAAIEFADIADDSSATWATCEPKRGSTSSRSTGAPTGMTAHNYYQDLCELRVWGHDTIDHNHERVWFGSAHNDEIPIIAEILDRLAVEASRYALDYQAIQAREARQSLPRRPRRRTRPTSPT